MQGRIDSIELLLNADPKDSIRTSLSEEKVGMSVFILFYRIFVTLTFPTSQMSVLSNICFLQQGSSPPYNSVQGQSMDIL